MNQRTRIFLVARTLRQPFTLEQLTVALLRLYRGAHFTLDGYPTLPDTNKVLPHVYRCERSGALVRVAPHTWRVDRTITHV